MRTVLKRLKHSLVPSGVQPRRVPLGLFRGIRLELDLSHQFQLYAGLFERELSTWLRSQVCRARSAVDIGSAAGEYAIWFLRQRSVERVVAVESDPATATIFDKNLSLNGVLGDVRLHAVRRFVADKDDEAHLTLDSLIPQLPFPCLVKIDVDGGEMAGLRGAGRMLERSDVFWLIEVHSCDLEEECLGVLQRAGLRTKIISQAWYRCLVPEFRTIAHNRWIVAQH